VKRLWLTEIAESESKEIFIHLFKIVGVSNFSLNELHLTSSLRIPKILSLQRFSVKHCCHSMHIKQRASVNVMFNIMSCGCVNLSNQCLNNSLHAIYVYINAFNRGRIATVSLCGVFFAQLFTSEAHTIFVLVL
jgi:hypothetical protein